MDQIKFKNGSTLSFSRNDKAKFKGANGVVATNTECTKQCKRCKLYFPATSVFFNSDKQKFDGFYSYCRKCTSSHRMFHYYFRIIKRCVERIKEREMACE